MGKEASAETRKDDLRTGTPLWVETPHSTIASEGPAGQARFDVIVVGAGISGALMAEALTARGKSVLILDRRPAARGSTAASTAMIQHEIDVALTDLRRQIGEDKANRAWLRSVRAVEDLVALSSKLQLDCQMQAKPAYYLSGTEMDADALAAEAKARQTTGIAAEYLTRAELLSRTGMDREAAIYSKASASANPAQLTAGLLQAALARKAHLTTPVEVTDMAESAEGVTLTTEDGQEIHAAHAVFCTGYEYLPQMKSGSHHVTSTWALASEPLPFLPDWMRKSISWEASDPYLYFRSDAQGRVIAGGEDEPASETNSDPEKLVQKAAVIAQKLEALTGVKIGVPAYTWSAPFSVTDDGLPIIDRVPGFQRIFTVMGFGGNGITFSVIGAQIIPALIFGESDRDADIFRFR